MVELQPCLDEKQGGQGRPGRIIEDISPLSTPSPLSLFIGTVVVDE